MPITSLFNLNEERERSKNSSYAAFCSPKVNPERDISEDRACITPTQNICIYPHSTVLRDALI